MPVENMDVSLVPLSIVSRASLSYSCCNKILWKVLHKSKTAWIWGAWKKSYMKFKFKKIKLGKTIQYLRIYWVLKTTWKNPVKLAHHALLILEKRDPILSDGRSYKIHCAQVHLYKRRFEWLGLKVSITPARTFSSSWLTNLLNFFHRLRVE